MTENLDINALMQIMGMPTNIPGSASDKFGDSLSTDELIKKFKELSDEAAIYKAYKDMEEKETPYVENKTILKMYKLLDMFKDKDGDYYWILDLVHDLEKDERKLTKDEMYQLNFIYKRIK